MRSFKARLKLRRYIFLGTKNAIADVKGWKFVLSDIYPKLGIAVAGYI